MIEPTILKLFPKIVYCQQDLMLDKIDYLHNTQHSLNLPCSKDSALSVNSSHKTFPTLHQLEPFKEFSDIVLDHARAYGKLLGYSDTQRNKFRFVNMWFNQSFKDDFNFPHLHNGSLISGVFYIKTVSKNKIVFQNFSDQLIEPDDPTDLAWNMSWVDTEPGLLLLFKSNLIHSNPRQEDESEKLIISFNVTMDL